MKRRNVFVASVVALAAAYPALAQDKAQPAQKSQSRDTIRDQDIYGSQMMTRQERDEHRNRMRSAKTQEERERIRAQHHELMRQRARRRALGRPQVGGPSGPSTRMTSPPAAR